MNIGFDAKRAFLNSSGLGNYSRTLVKSLAKYYPDNSFHLFTTKQGDSEFQQYANAQNNFTIHEPQSFIDKKLRSRWRSYGITELLNSNDISVYHGLSNEIPFNINNFKGKKIVTTHDLIFLRYPHLYPYLDRKIYNKKFRHSCDEADVIVAISEETKRDIEQFYFIPENKIKVIYQSCDEVYYQNYSNDEKNTVKEKYTLPSQFLLYVGTIEPRKNLMTIAKALKNVKDVDLVVVGRKTNYFTKVNEYLAENKLTNRVKFIDDISNQELAMVYQLATVFIFPSIFEGFGIPIIEALTSKVPVITSKGGCFPEAGGEHSIYINPEDENELADKINQLLNNSEERKAMSDKGYTYAQKFRPSTVTKQIMEVYK